MQKIYNVLLDTKDDVKNPAFVVNTNDLKTVKINLLINQDGEPLDLTGATVRLAVKKPDKTTVLQDITVVDALAGSCEIVLNTQAYVIDGKYDAEVMVYYGVDTVAVTGQFSYKAVKGILDDGSVESTNEWQSITQAIADNAALLEELQTTGTGVDAQARADIANIGNASPKGTYATLSALQTAFPTGATGIYVVTADGKWYYWSGTAWTIGGTYQSTGIADNTVLRQHLGQSAKIGYPFSATNTWLRSTQDVSAIGKAIKNIIIYNAAPNDKFYIERVRLTSGTLTMNLGKVGYSNPASPGSGEICASLTIASFAATDTITTVNFIPNNGTKISATMLVNWVEFDVNSQISVTPFPNYTYAITGIHQNCIFNVDLTKYETTKITGVPSTIYCTIGREINLYYRNMLNIDDPKGFFVETKGLEISECLVLKDCIRITPTKAFSTQMTINLYKGELLLATFKPTVISVADNHKTTSLLCIGDSITANAKYTAELLNINPNFTLLGTRGTGLNKHEGRSGWTADNYVNTQSLDGVTNAFYNPTVSKFDFNYYMTQNVMAVPNYVLINLGINDVANKIANDVTVSNLEFIINNIKAYSGSIKIILCLPTPPSTGRADQHYLKMTSLYESVLNKFTTENTLCLNLILDRETSFPTVSVPISARNTNTMIKVSDTIHPIDAGYWQIADAIYGNLNAN